ncbi:MAG: restriction endonuclease subunit S [Spartobacteria bacterium]|nr:restriction endonuclease subunit S [Spartobacteria bacterium]
MGIAEDLNIDLTAGQKKTVLALLARHLPGMEVWAYGSRARWNARPDSDLDLVAFAAPEDLPSVYALREAFEQSSLPFSVDLFVWDKVPESFHDAIDKEKVVVQSAKDNTERPNSAGWPEAKLVDVCVEKGVQTGPFGSQLHQKDYVSHGTPIITVEHLGENRILMNNVPLVSEEDTERLRKYQLVEGDIVFSRVGSVDRRAYIRNEQEGWLFSGRCLRVRPDPKKINPYYLSAYFGLPSFKEYIRSIAVGATMPSLNTALLEGVPVILPPANQQNLIASIARSIDDKIELNQRMNETLEGMARAVFKSWFVDFDPVHAKARGRQPEGMDAATAALFPATFNENGIPEGWSTTEIGEKTSIYGGGTPSTKNAAFWNGDIHWTSPKDLSGQSHPVLLDTERKITLKGLEKISSGLLPAGTVLMSSRAPIGYIAIAEVPLAVNQGYVAMVPDKGLPNTYIWQWIGQNMEEIKSRANGSTFQEISKKNFRTIPVIVPDECVLKAYHAIVNSLYQRIVSNVRESNILASLRDALLPKLISGEIRIGEAEEAVREAS